MNIHTKKWKRDSLMAGKSFCMYPNYVMDGMKNYKIRHAHSGKQRPHKLGGKLHLILWQKEDLPPAEQTESGKCET